MGKGSVEKKWVKRWVMYNDGPVCWDAMSCVARRCQRSQLYSRAGRATERCATSCLQFVAQPSSWLIDIINRSKAKARPSVGYPLGFAGNVLVSRWTQPFVRLIETGNRLDSKMYSCNQHTAGSPCTRWTARQLWVPLAATVDVASAYGIHFRLIRTLIVGRQLLGVMNHLGHVYSTKIVTISMWKTSQFITQCKGDISHAFKQQKSLIDPMMCKIPDVLLQDELLCWSFVANVICGQLELQVLKVGWFSVGWFMVAARNLQKVSHCNG